MYFFLFFFQWKYSQRTYNKTLYGIVMCKVFGVYLFVCNVFNVSISAILFEIPTLFIAVRILLCDYRCLIKTNLHSKEVLTDFADNVSVYTMKRIFSYNFIVFFLVGSHDKNRTLFLQNYQQVPQSHRILRLKIWIVHQIRMEILRFAIVVT